MYRNSYCAYHAYLTVFIEFVENYVWHFSTKLNTTFEFMGFQFKANFWKQHILNFFNENEW